MVGGWQRCRSAACESQSCRGSSCSSGSSSCVANAPFASPGAFATACSAAARGGGRRGGTVGVCLGLPEDPRAVTLAAVRLPPHTHTALLAMAMRRCQPAHPLPQPPPRPPPARPTSSTCPTTPRASPSPSPPGRTTPGSPAQEVGGWGCGWGGSAGEDVHAHTTPPPYATAVCRNALSLPPVLSMPW